MKPRYLTFEGPLDDFEDEPCEPYGRTLGVEDLGRTPEPSDEQRAMEIERHAIESARMDRRKARGATPRKPHGTPPRWYR